MKAPAKGAVPCVTVVSPQALAAADTSIAPAVLILLTQTQSTAFEISPLKEPAGTATVVLNRISV